MSLSEKIKANAIKDTEWLQKANERKINKDWLDISFKIAMKILKFLRENKITQRELAENLGFSPQYLNKILKGKENLTIETITKIQNVIGIQLIQVPDFLVKEEYNVHFLQEAKSSFYIDKSNLVFTQQTVVNVNNVEEVIIFDNSQYAKTA